MSWIGAIILSGIAWALGSVLTLLVMEENAELHDLVWWPITAVKFLFRTLWRALLSDWRP